MRRCASRARLRRLLTRSQSPLDHFRNGFAVVLKPRSHSPSNQRVPQTPATQTPPSLVEVGATTQEGDEFGPCKTCVFVIERIKKGTNMLLPAICSEIYIKFPDAYALVWAEHGVTAGTQRRLPAVPPSSQCPQSERQQRQVWS